MQGSSFPCARLVNQDKELGDQQIDVPLTLTHLDLQVYGALSPSAGPVPWLFGNPDEHEISPARRSARDPTQHRLAVTK